MKITTTLLTFGLLTSNLLWANTESITPPIKTTKATVDNRMQSPVDAIQNAILKLNTITKTQHKPQQIQLLLKSDIAPLFDFNHIAREVLNASGVRLADIEQQFFVKQIKQNMLVTLLSKLSQTNSTSFRFISARPIIGNNIVVNLQVIGYSPFSLYVDLLFHKNANDQWQIFDLVLNNDSLINYYQRVVSIKIKRYGLYGMLARF